MTRIAVVGGGAVGTTAARVLAERGVDVTLYDRGGIAAGATGRAAGICSTAFESHREGRFAERSLARFRELSGYRSDAGCDGDPFVFTDCPYVWLAREGDGETADAIREQAGRMRERGRTVEVIETADLGAEFPGLRTDDVAIAAVARDAGYADPAAYAELMADRAVAAGATVETETEVAIEPGDESSEPTVRTNDGPRPVEAVVVAAGARSGGLLAGVSVPVAMKPYRVQALITGDWNGSGVPICYDATGGYYLRPHGDGLLVGDGTQAREFDPDDWKREADAGFVAASLDRIERAVGERPAVDRAWAGLCTATPDRRPLVGPVGDAPTGEGVAAGGFHVATGFHGHGFMRAPAIGELVAEAVLDGDVVEAYDPRRFDGDEVFEVVEGMGGA